MSKDRTKDELISRVLEIWLYEANLFSHLFMVFYNELNE
jgi:hypothetical protein